jgi:dCMP deaminase
VRPTFDEYYLHIAEVVATRSDCVRRKHGAVIVSPDHRPISFGYNGAPAGQPGCDEGACPRGNLGYDDLASLAGGYDDPDSPGYCISIHAEANAIILAGRSATKGATIYVTGEPCHGCEKLISAAGIERVVW